LYIGGLPFEGTGPWGGLARLRIRWPGLSDMARRWASERDKMYPRNPGSLLRDPVERSGAPCGFLGRGRRVVPSGAGRGLRRRKDDPSVEVLSAVPPDRTARDTAPSISSKAIGGPPILALWLPSAAAVVSGVLRRQSDLNGTYQARIRSAKRHFEIGPPIPGYDEPLPRGDQPRLSGASDRG
jgi:hypothetical protein